MRVSWLLVLATGCGRFDFGLLPPDATDAAADAVVQFGSPALIPELDSPAIDDDPTLRDDELEIYLDSERAGGMGMGDIYVATRASTSDPFGTPVNVPGLNSAADETTPELSHDGLTLMFASDRAGGCGGLDLYIATRPSWAAPWSAPVLVPELCSPGDDASAVMTADGLHLAYSYDAGTGVRQKIVTRDRATTSAPWGPSVVEAALDPTDTLTVSEPFLDTAGTTLYFAEGVYSLNFPAHDLYVATRPTPFDRFGPPTLLDVSVPNEADLDPWVSPDGHRLYFTSHRNGTWQIFIATR